MRKCPKCGREFDPPTRICPDDATLLRDTVSQEEQPIGRTLEGKYRIDGFLKRGGMGAVYRGTHLLLNKAVAVKLIRPEIVTSEEMVERFFREARAAGKLNHPNIVTVHDLGQTDDGTLYIVMELVDGRSLKELIQKEGPMTPERALALIKGVASALSLAHKNDIVHRDLKPQNIMVTLDADGVESPKLLDFGIAKTLEPDKPELTATGMVMGTPHYMSSEQAKGKPADNRSDLYALGVILYEMLVGKVPFDDSSIPSILVKHLSEAPKPPSTLRGGIPPAVEAVVLRCMEKDPANRFQSATELIQAIDAPSSQPDRKASASGVAPVPLDPTLVETRATPPPAPAPPPVPRPASATPPPAGTGAQSQHTMAGAAAAAAPGFARVDSSTSSGTLRAHEVEPERKSANRSGIIVLVAIVVFLLGGVAAAFFVVRTVVTRMTGSAEETSSAADAGMDPDPEAAAVAAAAAADEEPMPEPPTESASGLDATPSDSSVANSAAAATVATSTGARGAPDPGTRTPAPVRAQAPPPTPEPSPASPRTSQPGASASSNAQEPAPAPEPEPAPDPAPTHPSFSIECRGVRDACAALRTVLRDALVENGMTPAPVERAELIITLEAEEVESRTEQQFGTTFVTRTYSVSGDTDVPRFDDFVALPSHTFSFDVRFGRDKLNEQSRVISADIARELSSYWSGKTGTR